MYFQRVWSCTSSFKLKYSLVAGWYKSYLGLLDLDRADWNPTFVYPPKQGSIHYKMKRKKLLKSIMFSF